VKKIIRIFGDYMSRHFDWRLYLGTFAFTAILVYLNFHYDFEDSVIDSYYDSYWRVLWYFLIHFIPYLAIVFLATVVRRDYSVFRSGGFWFFSILGFAVLGLDRGNPWQDDIAFLFTRDRMLVPFVFRLVNRLSPILTIFIPLWFIYLAFLRGKIPGFYGIHGKDLNLKPYFWLLVAMVPLIFIASFQPDFQRQYPNYSTARPEWFIEKLELSTTFVAVMYELFYSVSFFHVELFFRGFLIFVMTRYLGEEVVLPMAVTYCVLHFGKPVGEAISSFFGGYILGVLALKTRNIYGGIIIHIGIAWLMEIFAFLHI
jgi:hypothetical protein